MFYPNVGKATLALLKKCKVDVQYPMSQTCCGQPMANSGYQHLTKGCDHNFIQAFKDFDYVVAPSGSCVLHLKEHLKTQIESDQERATYLKNHIFELAEFLTDVLKVDNFKAHFPHSVGFHQSCHGQRGLRLSSMSELTEENFSKPESLLSNVRGINLIQLNKKDECCGFGGTFCVTEEAVSSKMGKDRIQDHENNGAEYITACDMSCLMHLEGIIKREKSKLKVVHIAEILNQNSEK